MRLVYPEPIAGKDKVDWDDALIHKGLHAVKKQLGIEIEKQQAVEKPTAIERDYDDDSQPLSHEQQSHQFAPSLFKQIQVLSNFRIRNRQHEREYVGG